ncbi:MAG: 16S rRNA (uracil(1498)-N(3))-methyltransferase [Desulfuromonadales bacterium]|nr:16S rRNA (uracil(1498)-N(3))-methyltransferase [Desulfuromonadales bacterium]
MRRFIVPSAQLDSEIVNITGELFRHMITVLRLSITDELILADERGREASAVILDIKDKEIICRLMALPEGVKGISKLQITLYQALPKGEKLDFILQKATELGVTHIVLFDSERSVVKIADDKLEKKLTRWRRIVQEAARQSGSVIPFVDFCENIADLSEFQKADLKLVLWEEEHNRHLKTVFKDLKIPDSIAVMVGPEGGFTEEEVAVAKSLGFISVTLGKRVLRTETAGITMLSILQYLWGDLG